MKNIFPVLIITGLVLLFFWQFFLKGLLPIPSDTIIGLYHPFRDLYAKNYPRGIPFKNYLITDPVRQIYPWKNLAVYMEKNLNLPLWNPYSLSGTPLLANFQSSVFYPLNILLFILPFSLGWSVLIFMEPFLAGIFLYFYLENINLNKFSALLGSVVFSFSGFFIAWFEWGTVTQVALWLPLVLLSVDRIFGSPQEKSKIKNQKSKIQVKSKNLISWSFIFTFSLSSAFFAGHLQTFFYLFLVSFAYFVVRWVQFGKDRKILFVCIILNAFFLILTSVQWVPTLQLILLSARNIDQSPLTNPGWFIPWQNLVQFVAPDFFGNPATLNYWGIWNYGEFVGYIGILPLILAFFALFFRHDKKTFFWGSTFFISLIFALPTIFAKLPFLFKIPFVDTAQPTRFMFIIDFSLSVLSALGLDYFLKSKSKKEIFYPLIFIGIVVIALWLFVLLGGRIDKNLIANLSIAKHNLIFPTFIFLISAIIFLVPILFKKSNRLTTILCISIVGLTVFDLFRFGWKFNPFTKKSYLFPNTQTINFLQKQKGKFRIMTTDSRILPPNFSVVYKLEDIAGYDPLYLSRYAELIAASQRNKPDINPPFGFNRIITPHNYNSKIVNLLGVRYILSLSDINKTGFKKVFQEGETRVYENKNALPRVFFVKDLDLANSKQGAIDSLFKNNINLKDTAVVEGLKNGGSNLSIGSLKIINYSGSKIIFETNNSSNGFLVLTDSYYPTWHATIDGRETKIYRTDFNFRGIFIPKGNHLIEFYDSIF